MENVEYDKGFLYAFCCYHSALMMINKKLEIQQQARVYVQSTENLRIQKRCWSSLRWNLINCIPYHWAIEKQETMF